MPQLTEGGGAAQASDRPAGLTETYLAEVSAAIERGDASEVRALVGALHEADTGDLIEALEGEQRTQLITLLGDSFDFAALTEVDDTVRDEILENLPPQTVAEGVRHLDSDDAVAILEDLGSDEQAAILEQLPASERLALKRSLDFPEYSAGRLMQTEFIAVPPFWTVGQTIDHLRETDDLPDRFFELYVVDPGYRLLGAVSLGRLLRTKRPVPISELLNRDKRQVGAVEDQEEVARLFARYDLVAAPVVDPGGSLVGVITIDDIVDVISEEAEEDIRAMGGVQASEELSDRVGFIARSRFPWLLVNLSAALMSSFVIGLFEHSIQQMVALAVLMPIVASMGGNAGTQTMTVTVRALATRGLSRSNMFRVLSREALVGLVNGLSFAAIIGVVAVIWFKDAQLAPVIGLALVVTLTAAALGGFLVPVTLQRLGVDPAVASGPFVTTITDVIGFFTFLAIATAWFGLR